MPMPLSPSHQRLVQHGTVAASVGSIDRLNPAANAVKEAANLLKQGGNRLGENAQLRRMVRDAKSHLKGARSLRLKMSESELRTRKGAQQVVHAMERAMQAGAAVLESVQREDARRTQVVKDRAARVIDWRKEAMQAVEKLEQDFMLVQDKIMHNTFVGNSTRDIANIPAVRMAGQDAFREIGFAKDAMFVDREIPVQFSVEGEAADTARLKQVGYRVH